MFLQPVKNVVGIDLIKSGMYNMPKLKKIDLSKSYKKAEKTFCPGINSRSDFLAKINNQWFAGKFSKEWYGWNFDGWFGVGLQFDPPGTNGSTWQELYEIL